MKKLSFFLGLAALSLPIISCSSEEVSDEVSEDKARMGIVFNTLTATETSAAISKTSQSKAAAAGVFSFTAGHIALESLEFEVETDNDSLEVDFELEQNTLIDFATGISNPDISDIVIPTGTFEEFEIEIELNDDYSEPAIVISGFYTAPDGMEHPVRFEHNSDDSFEIEREGVVVFEPNQTALAEITIDPRLWFAAVTDDDMAKATANGEGVILISENENTQVYEVVADGFELSREIELDDDNDDDDDDNDDDNDDDDDDDDNDDHDDN